MDSRGEKIGVLRAKALGLAAAALVVIALLLTAPLASFASARVEARAGDAVAIAGDDDCDVETNDAEEENISGAEDGDIQTQDGDQNNGDQMQNGDQNNGDQAQNGDQNNGDQIQSGDGDDGVQQIQNGNDDGNTVVARAGGAVAVASEDCDIDTESTQIEDNNEDIVVEDDEEIEDLTGQTDGDTLDTSDLSTLPPEEESTDDTSTDEDRAQDGPVQESELDLLRQLEANEPTEQIRRNESGRGGELGSVRLSNADWTLPKKGELEKISKPRRFDQKPGVAMTLSIRSLRLYDVPVTNSNTEKAFDQGVIHVPDTAYPWDKEDQKNVFLAGHRLGDPGEKDSRLVFYYLDELKPDDEIVLKDRKGRSYKYRVKEIFKVDRDDAWVADTLVGRDLLTLETYALPNLEDRIIVRADRVQQDSSGQQASARQPDSGRAQPNSVHRSDPNRQPNSVRRQESDRPPNSVRQQDSNRQQDSVRQLNSVGQQDSSRPNSDRKKKRK